MKYDVTISFAGEQRNEARSLAACLKSAGVEVFFDEYQAAELWGEDLYEHLSDIYQKDSRYCIVFVSEAYAQKIWTTHERRNAQARALREKTAYLLPVRFDNTELPGLTPTTAYLNFSDYGVDGICDAFLRKFGAPLPTTASSKTYSCEDSPLSFILAPETNTSAWVQVVKCRWGGQEVSLCVEPEEKSDESFLDSIRARTSIYIAYKGNVAQCRVADTTRVSDGDRNEWELKLQVQKSEFSPDVEMGFSGTTPDQLAEARARRLLLNENPRMDTTDVNRAFEEVFVSGQGVALPIKQSPFPILFERFGDDSKRFLEIAWIFAVFQLKLSSTVADILQLELAIDGNQLEINFSGRRKKVYNNAPAYEIRIQGRCLL
jgi:hypothetical protein